MGVRRIPRMRQTLSLISVLYKVNADSAAVPPRTRNPMDERQPGSLGGRTWSRVGHRSVQDRRWDGGLGESSVRRAPGSNGSCRVELNGCGTHGSDGSFLGRGRRRRNHHHSGSRISVVLDGNVVERHRGPIQRRVDGNRTRSLHNGPACGTRLCERVGCLGVGLRTPSCDGCDWNVGGYLHELRVVGEFLLVHHKLRVQHDHEPEHNLDVARRNLLPVQERNLLVSQRDHGE